MQVSVTALDLSEVWKACVGCLGGVHALILFLFICLYSLLMCLTKGQTFLQECWPISQAFVVTPLRHSLRLAVYVFILFLLFSLSLKGKEWCKETAIHIIRECTREYIIVVNTQIPLCLAIIQKQKRIERSISCTYCKIGDIWVFEWSSQAISLCPLQWGMKFVFLHIFRAMLLLFGSTSVVGHCLIHNSFFSIVVETTHCCRTAQRLSCAEKQTINTQVITFSFKSN